MRAPRIPTVALLAALLVPAGCSNKKTLTYTICNHSATDVCVTEGSTTQVVNHGDCVDFSKSTSNSCVTVTVAARDDTALGGCGATKGTKCMADNETWTVD